MENTGIRYPSVASHHHRVELMRIPAKLFILYRYQDKTLNATAEDDIAHIAGDQRSTRRPKKEVDTEKRRILATF